MYVYVGVYVCMCVGWGPWDWELNKGRVAQHYNVDND